MSAHSCPEDDCPGHLVLRSSAFGIFYGCSCYPKCDSTHPANMKTGMPDGAPVSRPTREQRGKVLDAINDLGRAHSHNISPKLRKRYRTIIYNFLAHEMPWKQPGVECIVAHFNIQDCARALELLASMSTLQLLKWQAAWDKSHKKHSAAQRRIQRDRAAGRTFTPLSKREV